MMLFYLHKYLRKLQKYQLKNLISILFIVLVYELKYTDIGLQTLQDKDMILLFEKDVRGELSSVMGDRCVKLEENKKILQVDANNLYVWAMSQFLPYDDIKFDRNLSLEAIINTLNDNDLASFVEVDLFYPDNIREKTKNFLIAPVN